MRNQTLIIIAAVGLLLAPLAMADETLAIIVNKNSPLENVTSSELVKIFRGEKSKAPDGTRFTVVMREPRSPEREAALRGIYQMSDQEYQKYFLQATFTGAVQAAPKKVTGASGVKSYISNNAGGIGYVKPGDVDGSVKVLKIDGKAPGESGYKLPND